MFLFFLLGAARNKEKSGFAQGWVFQVAVLCRFRMPLQCAVGIPWSLAWLVLVIAGSRRDCEYRFWPRFRVDLPSNRQSLYKSLRVFEHSWRNPSLPNWCVDCNHVLRVKTCYLDILSPTRICIKTERKRHKSIFDIHMVWSQNSKVESGSIMRAEVWSTFKKYGGICLSSNGGSFFLNRYARGVNTYCFLYLWKSLHKSANTTSVCRQHTFVCYP